MSIVRPAPPAFCTLPLEPDCGRTFYIVESLHGFYRNVKSSYGPMVGRASCTLSHATLGFTALQSLSTSTVPCILGRSDVSCLDYAFGCITSLLYTGVDASAGRGWRWHRGDSTVACCNARAALSQRRAAAHCLKCASRYAVTSSAVIGDSTAGSLRPWAAPSDGGGRYQYRQRNAVRLWHLWRNDFRAVKTWMSLRLHAPCE